MMTLNERLQSSVNNALEKYTGISIFDTTGQLKDTYDILNELAGVWGKLNVNVQTYLTTTLAGKNRADVLAAVLNNWEGVESAMASSMNSAGSALKEQQAYLDSIEGKQQALAKQLQAPTSLSGGEIAGICVGCVVGVALIGVILYFVIFRRKASRY